MSELIDRARTLLRDGEDVLVLTGAGISAESGVPTFRGPKALWRHFRPEELATPSAFARDPRLVWEWYAWRRELVLGCRPNAAHEALARFAWSRADVTIATQNVDGLHELAARAAAPTHAWKAPLELHGSLFRVRCTGCGDRYDHRGQIDASSAETLPRCVRCGALLRPDVVWFGEALDDRILSAATDAAARANVCLVIGTSAVVHPAAGLASITRRAGGAIVEVNPEPTPLTAMAAVSLRGGAVACVPLLLD